MQVMYIVLINLCYSETTHWQTQPPQNLFKNAPGKTKCCKVGFNTSTTTAMNASLNRSCSVVLSRPMMSLASECWVMLSPHQSLVPKMAIWKPRERQTCRLSPTKVRSTDFAFVFCVISRFEFEQSVSCNVFLLYRVSNLKRYVYLFPFSNDTLFVEPRSSIQEESVPKFRLTRPFS